MKTLLIFEEKFHDFLSESFYLISQTDEKRNRRRNLFEEAKKLDILIKDKHGEPYMVPNTAFDVGMLDLTHPDTGSWFKQVLQEMVDDGVRGWMADFGEGLPVDATLYSGIKHKLLERIIIILTKVRS